ncbi:unnamed protein product [Rotaria sp. Silwood2]|nr:unnamed protein product [Rotaria sp. Silwood2]CAF2923215.1 unnamed protein product [Rotaria sp. Silwood2]CAF3912623.1 unnamed protein product [Rotaria sp. Silwood2]CAF4642332.1 unnamed protein product [Rotaria sp. Silwood2]
MMMKQLFWCLLFFLCSQVTYCTQPYLTSQITFYTDDDKTLVAVNEINQQAYQMYTINSLQAQYAFAIKQFPYTIPDSPESKYYVQLISYFPSNSCMYGAYLKHDGFSFNSFPLHWNSNSTTFKIENYIKFNYKMIHSENNSTTEDYWYADQLCEVYSGENFPCEEIYFIKDTNISLRTTKVIRQGWDLIQRTTKYRVISIGKPDVHLFNMIPIK